MRGFRPREMRSLHGDTGSKVDIPVAMASIERVRRGPIVRGAGCDHGEFIQVPEHGAQGVKFTHLLVSSMVMEISPPDSCTFGIACCSAIAGAARDSVMGLALSGHSN